MADRKRAWPTPKRELTADEQWAKRALVGAVETMMLRLGAESVGRITDDVAEHGTGGNGGSIEDGVVLECLRVIVDAMGRGQR